jgi:hypothetical protein
MLHGTLTIVAKIRPSKVAALEALLKDVNEDIRQGAAHPFERVEGLYFARWGILAPGPDGERLLVFGVDFSAEEGRYRKRMREFMERFVCTLAEHRREPGPGAFDAIYRCCEGYPAKGLRKPTRVREFLQAHSVHYTARHVDFAYRVETAEGLRRLLALNEDVERHLNTSHRELEELAQSGAGWTARAHQDLRRRLRVRQPTLADPEWQRRWDGARLGAARATLLYPPLRYLVTLPLVGAFSAIAALEKRVRGLFRHCGAQPPHVQGKRAQAAQHLTREPEGQVQNPMIHVATIQPGIGAQIALWLTLRSVNMRLLRYVVGLNHIRAIHCARWVLLKHRRGGKGSLLRPRARRLLFFSNYDGSWESYIDSFVDDPEVKAFLVRIWSGTEGFPRSGKGRPFVEPFKAWIQQQQVPTRVWYSAHLHGAEGQVEPAVTDLHHMLRLRSLLERNDVPTPGTEQALRCFLSQGVFVPEPHLMRAREWLSYILMRRAPREQGRRLKHWRKNHVATRTITSTAAPASPAAAAAFPAEALTARSPAASGRHPGPGAPWVQGHGRRLLPAAEDRGPPRGPKMVAGDDPRDHDRG